MTQSEGEGYRMTASSLSLLQGLIEKWRTEAKGIRTDDVSTYGKGRTMHKRILKACADDLASTLAALPVQGWQPCVWSLVDEDHDDWHPSCGGAPWVFNEDGPVENGVRFCVRCGARVEVSASLPERQEP